MTVNIPLLEGGGLELNAPHFSTTGAIQASNIVVDGAGLSNIPAPSVKPKELQAICYSDNHLYAVTIDEQLVKL